METAEAQRAILRVDSRCVQALNLSEQGSSDGQDPAGSALCLAGVVGRVFGVGLAALPGSDVCRDRLRRTPYGLPAAENRRYVGRWPLVQLSPRPFEAALVESESGADSRPARGWSFSATRHDSDLWRRYGHAASREEGLWQGAASRCRALDSFLHGLALGAQMGGVGHPGPVAGIEPSLGTARPVRSLSFARGEQETRSSPQDAVRLDAATVVRAAAVVSPAEIPLFRRRRLWHAPSRAIRFPPAAPDIGQQVRQGRQPPQSAAETETRHEGPPARQRTQAALARVRGGENPSPPAAERLMVRWRSSTGNRRHGNGALVQGGARDWFPSAGSSSKT
jgi:hypothetical protein